MDDVLARLATSTFGAQTLGRELPGQARCLLGFLDRPRSAQQVFGAFLFFGDFLLS